MRNPDETKGAILHHAGSLFNVRGYKATSISNITEATGYTKGAIYRHFKNKEKLEEQSLVYLTEIMFEKLRIQIKEHETASDKLKAIFYFFESYVTKSPIKGGCPLLNVAIEADDNSPHLRKKAHAILEVLRESIKTILANGIKFEQIRKDIDKEYYATVIIASLEGAIMMSKLSRTNHDIGMIIRHLEATIKTIEN
ncbi:MAG: TetR/AcrR family transcriptional regulator [Cytophagales bacterium]|jgi:TetR/AcrR family transcriptional repressor of nem operon|nr:TetR/AcrR family transcriptional regulator [Cytophagales bacterium]MCA6388687.1 TetR/AcrR family transcriptional regulator [Cytophagales bacterium]MCA6392699.1 TetR/AcrR family transcriptional regulator [Cytophagales bacterium]MCA6395298.1 TetR/AcrR family transcriptional regulator [Cytophagales bacterium]MCA6400364.1 TetR/AcrR family transcriptional regulator [Cytophagales bacterium]